MIQPYTIPEMWYLKCIIFTLSTALATAALSQPTNTTVKLTQLETAPTTEGTKAGQIGLTTTNGKQRYSQFTEIEPVAIAYTPTATGNSLNLSEFVTDPTGDIYYIDWQGRGLKIYESSGGGGIDKNGYYSGNNGNGGDQTIPSSTTSTLTNQLTFYAPSENGFGGTIPIRIKVDGDDKEFISYVNTTSLVPDSLYLLRQDDAWKWWSPGSNLQMGGGLGTIVNGAKFQINAPYLELLDDNILGFGSDRNNWVLNKSRSKTNQTASVNVTGIANGSDGRFHYIFNESNFNLTFKHESTASSASNRFNLGGTDFVLAPYKGVFTIYDGNSSRWFFYGIPGADNWGSQTVAIGPNMTGDGTSGNPLDWAGANVTSPIQGSGTTLVPLTIANNSITQTHIATGGVGSDEIENGAVTMVKINQGGATNGQVLKWNNTLSTWEPSADNTGGAPSWGSITGTLSAQTDLQTALDGKVDENAPITGATKTKITYDAKGLVTAGADATTSDIAEGSNLYFTNERVDDRIDPLFVAGTGISKAYNDALNTFTVTNTGDTDASNDITTSTSAGGDLNGTYPNPTVDGLQGRAVASTAPTNGQVLKWNNTLSTWEPSADNNSGTVTSVAVSAPTAEFDISGSPITTNGTIAITWDNQTTNKVFAAPDGSTGQPSFRALASNDIPTLTSGKISDFTEAAQDAAGAMATSGAGINFAYNDAAGTLTVTNTGDTDASNDITTSTSAGGDLNGTYPNPTVDGLQGRAVASTAPTNGQVLKWNNTLSTWEPSADNTGGAPSWGSITGTLSAQTDLQTALDGKVDENAPITGATKTKITYDAKGLVTAGADATTSDIAEGSNLYFTDERVDDRIDPLFVAGTGISKAYNDALNTFTVTNTGDTDASNDITTSTSAGGDLNGTYPNPTVDGLQGRAVASTAPTNGQVLKWNNTLSTWEPAADNNSGTVTSVAVSAPTAEFDISGSPITTNGTISLTWDNQTTNKVFAAPDGSTGQPSFRALASNDIPTLTSGKISDFTEAAQDAAGAMATSGAGINFAYNDAAGTLTVTNTGDTDASNDITTSTSAGGDLNGTYPNPTVDGLQGRAVASTAPTNGQVLKWNNTLSTWEPADDDSGGSIPGTDKQTIRYNGTTPVANDILRNDGSRIGINKDPQIGFDLSANAAINATTYVATGAGLAYSTTAASSIRMNNTVANRFWYLGHNDDGTLRLYNDGPIQTAIWDDGTNKMKQLGDMVVGDNSASIAEAQFVVVDSVVSETNAVVENKMSNSVSNSKITLKAANASADSYIYYTNSTGDYSMGIDGSLSGDPLRITPGTTIGGVTTGIMMSSVGYVAIGSSATAHNGLLTVGAGTTSLAPLTLTTGSLKTTVQNGAIEYTSPNFYVSDGGVRYTVAKCLTGSTTWNPASTVDGDYQVTTFTVTGAADGDVVSLGVPNASVPATSNCFYTARVSATNTVELKFHNISGGALDPGSGTFKVTVTKF